MGKNSKRSKQSVAIRAGNLLAGVKKHYASVPSLTFASATHTIQEITQDLQALIDLRKAVDDARSALMAKLANEQARAPSIVGMMAELTAFVRAAFSNSPDVLADFGIKKKARTALTGAQAVAAAAKAEATREARGTIGKRAKAAKKGDVVSVAIVPVKVAPVGAPAAPSTPAPAGGATGGGTQHGV
jgi:hypothetical protein